MQIPENPNRTISLPLASRHQKGTKVMLSTHGLLLIIIVTGVCIGGPAGMGMAAELCTAGSLALRWWLTAGRSGIISIVVRGPPLLSVQNLHLRSCWYILSLGAQEFIKSLALQLLSLVGIILSTVDVIIIAEKLVDGVLQLLGPARGRWLSHFLAFPGPTAGARSVHRCFLISKHAMVQL